MLGIFTESLPSGEIFFFVMGAMEPAMLTEFLVLSKKLFEYVGCS